MAVAYTVGPWLVLWRLGDHRNFRQSVGAGVLFGLIASFLDDYGVSKMLWWYPEQPIPLMTGNALWNIVGAAPEAILVAEKALAEPQKIWYWVIGLALANAGAEYFALLFTDLLAYPRWSPLLSLPVYVVIFWVIIWYTRWVWAPPPAWQPPGVQHD